MHECRACRAAIDPIARFCPQCGAAIAVAVEPVSAAPTPPVARSLLARQADPVMQTVARRLDDEGWTLDPAPRGLSSRRDVPGRIPSAAVADRGPDAAAFAAVLRSDPTPAAGRRTALARLLGGDSE